MTTRYAEVIGDPIDQSKSPIIHAHWLKELGMEGDYRRTKVAEEDFAAWLAERRADPAWRGANVTMPLKLAALSAADSKSDRAITAGAANLLLPEDGKLLAGNSDVGAIAYLMAQLHDQGAPMRRLHLFGTGGAARAALVALRTVGVDDVTIHSRNRQKAIKLAVEFGIRKPVAFDQKPDGDGLINATPLGMVGHNCLNCDVGSMNADGWVFDMVSSPADTPLVQAARARGMTTVDGIAMLVEQAASSFELFFGSPPKRARDDELFAMLRG